MSHFARFALIVFCILLVALLVACRFYRPSVPDPDKARLSRKVDAALERMLDEQAKP